MKKIMFNDRFGLTEAVLSGAKTQTRRVITDANFCAEIDKNKEGLVICKNGALIYDGPKLLAEIISRYSRGEVVAVAQSYKTINNDLGSHYYPSRVTEEMPSWKNKMFVLADAMPHQIRITNVRIERLQDISEEDCFNEGIYKGRCGSKETHFMDAYYFKGNKQPYCTPIDAYSELIDEVCGKRTWASNPFVWVYDFELLR